MKKTIDLKPSIHSVHNNRKTLELFNKSSVVDFTIDEILTELGNDTEILNGNILLFPPIHKQEISPSPPIVPFTSSSLICHKKGTGAKKGRNMHHEGSFEQC